MKKWLIIAITACILLSLLGFIAATDMERVVLSVSRVGYNFAWLILITGIAYYFGTLSWRYCFGEAAKEVSTIRLFLIRHVGETFSLFNPASVLGGDSIKVMMLGNYGIDRKRVIASVVLSRLVMVASQLSLFIFTLLALAIQNPGFSYAHVQGKVMAFYPLILVKVLPIRRKIGRFLIRRKIVRFLGELRLFFRNHRKALAGSVLFALAHWLFGALEFYFILKFLDIEVSILQALLIDLGVVLFKAAGAFIPGQIGVEEYGNKIMLMAVGIPNTEIWISASILRRARQLVWIAFGVLAYALLVRRPQLSRNE